ncbi:MAG: SDR family NAD(P)-dependent oxidoreductase [Dehalococcoidia bacterium]
MRFENKVAIVTGGGDGIGYGITERLSSEGANVMVVDFNSEIGSQSVNEIDSKNPGNVRLTVGDVSQPKTSLDAVKNTLDTWGKIDILVNNAGIGGINGNIWELDVEELDRVYQINLRGVFLFCQAVIPHMVDNNFGRIVNMASTAGKEGNPRMVPYSSTKAAVIALTKSVGKELAATNVLVNCVTPAVVQTKLLEEFTPEQIKYMTDKIPMGRTGEIKEIAALVSWLCSEECSFSTGAAYDASGGRATY